MSLLSKGVNDSLWRLILRILAKDVEVSEGQWEGRT